VRYPCTCETGSRGEGWYSSMRKREREREGGGEIERERERENERERDTRLTTLDQSLLTTSQGPGVHAAPIPQGV